MVFANEKEKAIITPFGDGSAPFGDSLTQVSLATQAARRA